jgi:hypothetical protein
VLAAQKDAARVDRVNPLPDLERRLEHGAVVGRRDAGVVEENVNGAELGAHAGVGLLNLALVAHVGLEDEIADRALGEVDPDHGRALLAEEPGALGPDAARRTGDDADLALEPRHGRQEIDSASGAAGSSGSPGAEAAASTAK